LLRPCLLASDYKITTETFCVAKDSAGDPDKLSIEPVPPHSLASMENANLWTRRAK
jgi:hypothetical protein